MRKRDRILSFFTPERVSTRENRPPSSPSPLPLHTSLQPPSTVSDTHKPAPLTTPSPAFRIALETQLSKIPESDKAAFVQAFESIDERDLLSEVQAYDDAHKNDSTFRLKAERLTKTLELLKRLMGGVAIGIQTHPEISAIVVGAIRVVIDLGLHFTTFFSRLTNMICEFADYLRPLMEYARAIDVKVLEETTANAYVNLLDFAWKARRVFVDANGVERKWTSLRAFMRQHWDSFESEFLSIREDMRHYLYILLHSVQALHFNKTREFEQLRQREEERKEKSEFLSWISNLDFEKFHCDTYAKKHEQTCGWLIRAVEFQQWFNQPVSSILWCHGKPGIGKSVLASHVLEYITAEKGLQEDTAVCFAYYNYRDTRLGDVAQVITSLIKQLCRGKDKIPTSLLQLKHEALSPSLAGTYERFISVIEGLSEVFVVFDALDECPEQNRTDILSFVTAIATAPISCCVKVFITSRREMDIAKAFENEQIPTIQIQADTVEDDIKTFVHSQVEKLTIGQHGKFLYVSSEHLKDKITHTLASNAEGMFLWVNFQLDNLCYESKAKKDRVVEQALDTLPQGLPDTYVQILNRIEAQPTYMRELALDCLAWIIYARRPLRVSELQIALATKADCRRITELELDPLEVILEACGNLIEEVNGFLRPIHFTVQEFLREPKGGLQDNSVQQKLLDLDSMHRKLGFVCLQYIHLAALSCPALDAFALFARLVNYEFAHYACNNFDYHITQCDHTSQDVMLQVEELFQQKSEVLAAVLQIRGLRNGTDLFTIEQDFRTLGFSVSQAAFIYGTQLYDMADLKRRWAADRVPQYALHLASSAGVADAVTRLLAGGADANEKDEQGATAIYYASSEAHLPIVIDLVRNGADVNSQGGNFGNALQAASYGGYEQIVKLLLENGADARAHGGLYGYALQAASGRGYEKIASLLLEAGANINAPGAYQSSALQAASEQGYKHIVTLLLENGADVNIRGGLYGNALQAAAYKGHEHIVELLLEWGADVNLQGGGYGNALQAAAYKGYEQIVRLLLDKGADIMAQGGVFGSTIQAAACGGHENIVSMLLEMGIDPDTQGQGGYFGNAIEAASGRGYERVVKLLLERRNLKPPER